VRILAPVLFVSALLAASAPGVEQGVFPPAWITGGPNCLEVPDWQIHEYNANLYFLRESGCTHYEKPFLYLFFGSERALLIDTGAGASDAASVAQKLIAKWCKRAKRESLPLVVAHTHGHGDHVAGDKGFADVPNVTLIPATVEGAKQAFHIENWPASAGSIDLGGRAIDVIPIPGHHVAHVAYYDRQTGILHTGDHLYAGRLYVSDFAAYLESTRRLVEFTATRPVSHIVGCHIEQSSTPFVDYPVGTQYQPHEHTLQLGRGELIELLAGLEAMHGKPERAWFRDFTIWPR
jgi:glyoxylase-like metal-dependent hydrolase (beta-lactamase superfamily II)